MFRENLQRGYATRQDCILYVKCLAERLGYTPVKTDIGEREMYLIKTHYTAWTHVIRDAGLECSVIPRQKKRRKARLDERLIFLAEVFIETPDRVDKEEYLFLRREYTYGKKQIFTDDIVITKNAPKEQIRAYLQEMADVLGYTPTVAMTRYAKQISKCYESWYAALSDAGLELPNTNNQLRLRAEE